MNKYDPPIPLKHHPKPKTLDYILQTEDFPALQSFVDTTYEPPVSLDSWSHVAFSRIHEYMSCDGLSAQQALNKLYMDVLVSLQDKEDDARFEEEYEEPTTCRTCNTSIYNSDPYAFDREGNHLCERCSAGLVEVFYMKYHNNGVYFDILCASIPPEDVATLYVEVAPACTVVEVEIPAAVEERRYDKTNLPDFVELYEGTYRYVPGKRIKF